MDLFSDISPSQLLSNGNRSYHSCSELLSLVEKGDYTQITILQQELIQLQQISTSLSSNKLINDIILSRKIEHFIEKVKEITNASSIVISKYNTTIRQKQEREQLLTHRKERNNEFELQMDNDSYNQEMERREKSRDSLKYSNKMADAVIDSSYEVLAKLQTQNELIARIRNNLTELGGSIGMSDQLIRTIDRRLTEDKWLVYGGMIGILILIIILYYIFAD